MRFLAYSVDADVEVLAVHRTGGEVRESESEGREGEEEEGAVGGEEEAGLGGAGRGGGAELAGYRWKWERAGKGAEAERGRGLGEGQGAREETRAE